MSYQGMSKLYTLYKDKPFRIFAFPSNQYGDQEPKSNEWIESFVRGNGTHVCGRLYCNWVGYFPYPLLAKGCVKPDWCTSSPASSCTAASTACCSKNDEVWKWLLSLPLAKDPGVPKWNFAGKFLLDRCGNPVFYKNDQTYDPALLTDEIDKAIAKQC